MLGGCESRLYLPQILTATRIDWSCHKFAIRRGLEQAAGEEDIADEATSNGDDHAFEGFEA